MTTKDITEKLDQMGLRLPEPAAAVGAYVPAVVTGSLVFVSGQLPLQAGQLRHTGKLGADVSLEAGQDAARICALNGLAAAAHAAGGLDRIQRIVRLGVFVNSAPDFTDQAKVANGASELLVALFGEPGRHARAAVGVAALPLDAAVEIELLAEIASEA